MKNVSTRAGTRIGGDLGTRRSKVAALIEDPNHDGVGARHVVRLIDGPAEEVDDRAVEDLAGDPLRLVDRGSRRSGAGCRESGSTPAVSSRVAMRVASSWLSAFAQTSTFADLDVVLGADVDVQGVGDIQIRVVAAGIG